MFSHPDRIRPRFRPFKALRHFRNLIADKEDTEQVFHIFEALPRSNFVRDAKTFVESDQGKALMQSENYLPTTLDDHDRLKQLPANSVGRAYVKFMESEGLTAQGLVDEYDKFRNKTQQFDDQIEWYGNRQRDTHDLFHVLTGYGRDPLGEQCVLAFTYGQNRNLGNIFIAYAGAFELSRRVKSDAPIFAATVEGQRRGKRAGKIADQNIMELLAEPLDAARERLNIGKPTQYDRAHEIYRSIGIDPYDFLAGAGATAAA